jgi:hypothetical protein
MNKFFKSAFEFEGQWYEAKTEKLVKGLVYGVVGYALVLWSIGAFMYVAFMSVFAWFKKKFAKETK